MAGHKAVDDGGLTLEEYVEHFGALEGGAVVVEDETGRGGVDADLIRIGREGGAWGGYVSDQDG